MQTKLTLRLESTLIQQAKEHARQEGKSLSQVVADYFRVFVHESGRQETAPVTRSLVGVLESSDLDADDYKKHLQEKYL